MQKVLIANRGEIALRVQRTCRELGIKTVGAYAAVDKDLLHLRHTDEIFCVSENDYLCAQDLVSAAKISGCDAVHPGYGFLAENQEFCQMTEDEGLIFIGPTPLQIAEMGDKIKARHTFRKLGLNPVPGSEVEVSDPNVAMGIARDLGFPVVVKAALGGGGKGIRVVKNESELVGAVISAKAEAKGFFGDDSVYLEKFLDDARHIEVQIFGDGLGNVIHFGTRECSIQRRQQKLIEEAPASGLTNEETENICSLTVGAVAELRYRNAGTLEFLYQDGEFYFVEMNTRIQVEHPVSELISGRDLVELQLMIADNNSLPFYQDSISFQGCAMECRVNAEDKDYHPCPGLVSTVIFPGGSGVRVDSHLYGGYVVPHQFDSLIAKLIAWDLSRSGSIKKMDRMLEELKISGISTNKDRLLEVIRNKSFLDGVFNTQFLTRLFE